MKSEINCAWCSQFMRAICRLFAPIIVLIAAVFSISGHCQNEATKQCVMDICHQMDAIASANGVGPLTETIDAHSRKFIKTSIEPLLNQMIKNDLTRVNNLVSFWEDLISKDPYEVKISDGQKITMAVTILSNLDWDFLNQVLTKYDGEKIEINEERARELLTHFSEEQVSWIIKFMDLFYNSRGYQTMMDIWDDPVEMYLERIVSDTYTLEKYSMGINSMAILVFNSFGLNTIFSQTDLNLLKRISEYQAMTSYEKRALNSVIAKVNLGYYLVVEGELRNLALALPFTLKEFIDLVKPKVDSVIEVLNNKKAISDLKLEALNYCSKMSYSYIASTPSELKLTIAQRNIERVKAASINVLPLYFGEENILAATDAINKIEFFFPMSRSEARPALESHFKARSSDSQIRSSSVSDLNALLYFLLNMGSVKEGLLEMMLQDTQGYCEDLKPAHIIDAALKLETPKVSVGWQSVFWPSHGASVISHEIGHVVEGILKSRLDLIEPYQCFIDQHKNFYGSQANVDGSQNNEDWADHFAISVQSELAKTYGDLYSANHACFLFNMDDSERDIEAKQLDLKTDATESHSTSIFRLLKHEAQTRGLPNSCKSLPEVKDLNLPFCAK